MAKIVVTAGACGETVEATAKAVDDRYANVKIGKCCEYVERMKQALEAEPLDGYKLMKGFAASEIYKSAGVCLPHVTCPVPAALHKLVELELGLAVAADVVIKIEK